MQSPSTDIKLVNMQCQVLSLHNELDDSFDFSAWMTMTYHVSTIGIAATELAAT